MKYNCFHSFRVKWSAIVFPCKVCDLPKVTVIYHGDLPKFGKVTEAEHLTYSNLGQ